MPNNSVFIRSIISVFNQGRNQVSRLRFEEFLALLFFIPMILVTTKAYIYLLTIGKLTRRIEGGMVRIIVTVLVFALFITILKRWKFIRDWLPFGFCIAIYTNLHDTIYFVNPNDIQNTLMAIDQWLFGVQPCVWAERFVNPVLTDIFTFCYSLFFFYGPVVALTLYLKKQETPFRHTMLSIILGFYIGYFLYILFPAAPPRYVLRHEFSIKLSGEFLEQTRQIINIAAHKSRGAFPSLHTAGTLIALVCAWRYIRWMFWVLLPFGIGLIVGTVYLRHHYVIDLIAGAFLAPLAIWVGARVDKWWDFVRNRFIETRDRDNKLNSIELKTTCIEANEIPDADQI